MKQKLLPEPSTEHLHPGSYGRVGRDVGVGPRGAGLRAPSPQTKALESVLI